MFKYWCKVSQCCLSLSLSLLCRITDLNFFSNYNKWKTAQHLDEGPLSFHLSNLKPYPYSLPFWIPVFWIPINPKCSLNITIHWPIKSASKRTTYLLLTENFTIVFYKLHPLYAFQIFNPILSHPNILHTLGILPAY